MTLRALAKKIPFARELWAAFNRILIRLAAASQPRGSLAPSKWLFRDPNSVDGCHSPEEFLGGGRSNVRWLIDRAGIEPTDRFLDVGCGVGRIVLPLADFLQHGTYRGFDIEKWKIAYCRRTVGQKRPDFAFLHADVFNKYYNPGGRMHPREYRFPFDDGSFDFVLLTSVFTHMLPVEMEHYLSEVARVMSPGATCVITYFLFDSTKTKAWHSISDVCDICDPKAPELGVAYLEQFVTGLYGKHGLQIVTLVPGADRRK